MKGIFRTAALLVLLSGCGGVQSVLDPRGHNADRIADLWWLMFVLGGAVWIVVTAITVYVLFFRRASSPDRPIAERTEGDRGGIRWVVGGTAVTILILVVVFVSSLLTGRSIQALETPEPLTIEVIGHQWWWEVRYIDPVPSRRFTTANEIRVPAGRTVRLQLRSEDVVHSFWVPNISGKTDLVPGRTNTLHIRGDVPGVYRGQCAQFCGMQHTNMALAFVVETPDAYEAWAANQLRPADPPTDPVRQMGHDVFMTRGCVLCHTIRGTPARGHVGPDLTHLASRLTLASGILPNTRGHLAGWLANPQVLKPGNLMPRVPLASEELQALLFYLETLD